MALILALNPGNSHSPTLARLARQLHGCELIGAESCVVALKSIKQRLPDVVLLPAKPARGEADFIAHLKSVPGGVPTLTLPPVESADPVDLARQIREILTGIPNAPVPVEAPAPVKATAPAATSPHLLAAAAAAVDWIHRRRAQWISEPPVDASPEPVAQWTGASTSDEPREVYEPREPREPSDLHAPDEPYAYEPIPTDGPHAADEPYGSADSSPVATQRKERTAWLPRAAAVAVVMAIAGATALYWPQIRGAFGNADRSDPPPEQVSQPPRVNPEPVAPSTGAEPESAEKVSGWVVVSSPFEVQISEGNEGLQVDDRGRVVLAPGKHRLRFQNPGLGYDETRTVEVRATETTTIKLSPQTTIAVTSTEPAEVMIDGTRVGDTPYEGTVPLGPHSVTVRSAGAERELKVEATSEPVRLEVDFSKP